MNASFEPPESSPRGNPVPDASLTPSEATYVDRVLSEGDAAGRPVVLPPAPENEALRTVHEILTALGRLPEPAPPPGLVGRTMSRIRSANLRRLRYMMPAIPLRRWRQAWNPRVTNIAALLAAACVLITVTSLLLMRARQRAAEIACADNLQQLAGAFSEYAAVNFNRLPELTPPQDGNWLPRKLTGSQTRSPDAHSNLTNLVLLVKKPQRYTTWNRLICPGRPVAMTRTTAHGTPRPTWGHLGYNYLDQLASYHHHWNGNGHVVVLADRNPLFDPLAARHPVKSAQINSFNHGGSGQNILCDDGRVAWVTSPDVGPRHSNIWALGNPPLLQYTGLEEPASSHDIIVVP